jgi:hypothetical protein
VRHAFVIRNVQAEGRSGLDVRLANGVIAEVGECLCGADEIGNAASSWRVFDDPASSSRGHDINYVALTGVLHTVRDRGRKPMGPSVRLSRNSMRR